MDQEPSIPAAKPEKPAGRPRKMILTKNVPIPLLERPFWDRFTRKSVIVAAIMSSVLFSAMLVCFFIWKVIEPLNAHLPFAAYIPEDEPLSQSLDWEPPSPIVPNADISLSLPDYSFQPVLTSPAGAVPDIKMTADLSDLPFTRLSSGRLSNEFAFRCSSGNRLRRLQAGGGRPEYDDAVGKGLKWLGTRQNSDGSWGNNWKCAMTGLSLLAHIARCETPYSEEFGETCHKGIAFLISTGKKNNGVLSETPKSLTVSYEHAIAVYALAEAHIMCTALNLDIPGLSQTVKAGAEFIVRHQANSGSWYYGYALKSSETAYPDLSITGWNIQALKAVSRSTIQVEGLQQALHNATRFVKGMSNSRTGMFAYREGDYCPSMTAVGTLCLQLANEGKIDEAVKGLNWLRAHRMKPDYQGSNWDLYLHYYCAQAFINDGGAVWKAYGTMLGQVLFNAQSGNGSWPAPNNKNVPGNLVTAEDVNGTVYRTSLALLTLSVYYRYYLPSRQRVIYPRH